MIDEPISEYFLLLLFMIILSISAKSSSAVIATPSAVTSRRITRSPAVAPANTTTTTDTSKIVIKSASSGHSLVQLKRTRVKGFCVECIRKKSDPNYKKTMTKIITYCPTCPGGIWLCEPCFDEKHRKLWGMKKSRMNQWSKISGSS